MLRLLQIMPNLEHLTFTEVGAKEDELTPYIGEMLPRCFHSRIKEVQITKYDFYFEDFPILDFLLNNITALKITDIIYSIDTWKYEVKTFRMERDSLDF
ncbi:hypothetical protein Sjap_014590 [Stephania japonica]|uniref:FBD domain-containing protein n=1 Tax=Stephania japonica TaxID=461633 RepID=A0AAP0NQK5_9MAGN